MGLLLIIFFSLCDLKYGAIFVSWRDVINALLHPHLPSVITTTLVQVRLPIVMLAIIGGAGIAIAGLLLQRITQNPLACPSLMGMEYGTAFFVILSYMFIPHITRPLIIAFALLGGLFTYLLMQWVAKKIHASTTGIILVGVAFDALYFSGIQAIMLAFPYQAQALLYNLNGSLQGITLADIKLIIVPVTFLFLITLLLSRRLDWLELDEDQTITLGVRVKPYRFMMLSLSILFTALMTSLIGPLLFFSLVVPHLVQPVARGYHAVLFCAVFGAAFLLLAEFMTRLIAPMTPPPVGLVTLLMGAPMMIYITRRYLVYDE